MDDWGGHGREENLRRWPSTEDEARAVQEELRHQVRLDEQGPEPGFEGTVVGVDVAYDDERGVVAAAAVALDARTLEVVEEATAVGPVTFPYVPGLLAFREVPAALEALGRLTSRPGLVVCDGYGLAHPRRFGLACHLGVLTDLPTIGVAKSPFTFRFDAPAAERGACSSLLDATAPSDLIDGTPAGSAEEVGRAVRTQRGVKPVFVSVGHRVDLDHACALTLALAPSYRLPETTRAADAACRRALRRT